MKRERNLWIAAIAGLLLFCLGAYASSCSFVNGQPTFDVCSAVKFASTGQKAVELAATTMVGMSTGIPAPVMQKAEAAYGAWVLSQATLKDAIIAINDAGGNPTAISLQTYQQLIVEVGIDAAAFFAVYQSIVATPALPPREAMMTTSTTPCTMTDADITTALTPVNPFPGGKK